MADTRSQPQSSTAITTNACAHKIRKNLSLTSSRLSNMKSGQHREQLSGYVIFLTTTCSRSFTSSPSMIKKANSEGASVKRWWLFTSHSKVRLLHSTILETIFHRVKFGKVDSEVVAKWIIDLVKAVRHLHSNGFFHRFFGNANVMVTADDRIVLGGFHKMIEAEESDKEIPYWTASPECLECFLKERATYDTKHDVW